MDSAKFDRFARMLGGAGGRRALVQAGIGTAIIALTSDSAVEAKQNRKKKRRCSAKTCGGRVCGPHRCKGTCGTCTGTTVCIGGQCCDVCPSGCPFATIGDAINESDADAVIALCPGTYEERIGLAKSLTLIGQGSDPSKTVIRNLSGPVVLVKSDTTVTLRNLTVTGATTGTTGGIQNLGTMILTDVHVTGNRTDAGATAKGGGIFNDGSLRLEDCLISDNKAEDGTGGGIQNDGATTTFRTRIEGNTALRGGGIDNQSACTLDDNSRITGNTATAAAPAGGGVRNGGSLTFRNGSSITGNTPDNCAKNDGSPCFSI